MRNDYITNRENSVT